MPARLRHHWNDLICFCSRRAANDRLHPAMRPDGGEPCRTWPCPCRRYRPHQGSGSHAGLLDHQDRRHHAGRDRRRHRVHDAELGLSRRHARSSSASLVALVVAQILAKKFHPFLYWATIVASTTFGTTMADFADRSLGIGYTGGSTLLFAACWRVLGALVLVARHRLGRHRHYAEGRGVLLGGHHVLADARHRARRLDRRHRRPRIRGRRAGLRRGARRARRRCITGPTCRAWRCSGRPSSSRARSAPRSAICSTSRCSHGGLAFSRPLASAVIAVFIVGCILLLPQRAGTHPGQAKKRYRS